MTDRNHMEGFAREIWAWYARHKRALPWRDLLIRDDTQRAYMVLVSEIMLQQTQVPRVVVIFRQFLERFPTLKDLAEASNKEVILAWRGMGYNSRALRLRDAAKIILKDHGGVFPKEMKELLSIKGIGPYTAAAVRNFAFNIPTPCIDTNIRRILHRSFIGPERADGTWEASDKELLLLAEELLEVAIDGQKDHDAKMVRQAHHDTSFPKDAANWHAALMDFGSLVCTKTSPKWEICPLTANGLMKAAYKVPALYKKRAKKTEPGRMVGAKFIPNRIFRGRIVDALRDAKKGMTLEEIGSEIATDWNPEEHEKWLEAIVDKLVSEEMVRRKGKRIALH